MKAKHEESINNVPFTALSSSFLVKTNGWVTSYKEQWNVSKYPATSMVMVSKVYNKGCVDPETKHLIITSKSITIIKHDMSITTDQYLTAP
jgi:hypothetical protein